MRLSKKLRYNAPSVTEQKILAHLTQNGSANKYRIQKAAKIKSYDTVYKAVKRLLTHKMIRVTEESKARTGLIMKKYDVTPSGLVWSLLTDSSLKENINKIADIRSNFLPLVLGKWNHFSNFGSADLVLQRLLEAPMATPPDESIITSHVLNPLTLRVNDKRERTLLQAIASDQELFEYNQKKLAELLKEVNRFKRKVEESRKVLDSFRNSQPGGNGA